MRYVIHDWFAGGPCLDTTLPAFWRQLQEAHERADTGVSFDDRREMLKGGRPSALTLERGHFFNFWPHLRAVQLHVDIAIAYGLEAKLAYDAGDHAMAWAKFSRASYFLGILQARTQVAAAAARGKKWDPLIDEMIRLIQTTEHSAPWRAKDDAWADIGGAVEKFNQALTLDTGRVSDAYDYFIDKTKKGRLRAALDVAMDGPIAPGRKANASRKV